MSVTAMQERIQYQTRDNSSRCAGFTFFSVFILHFLSSKLNRTGGEP